MPDLMRPTFTLLVRLPSGQAAKVLEALFRDGSSPFVGQSVGSHLTMTLAPGHRHFWSPWLHIDLRPGPEDDDTTDAFARFSPAPSIWTAYMLGYLALLTTALGSGMWAIAQWTLGQRPTLLWGVVLPAVIAGIMLWSARVGQALARGQMRQLHDAVTEALRREERARQDAP